MSAVPFDVGLFVRNVGWSIEQLIGQIIEIPALEQGFPADWVRPPTAGTALVAAERLRQQLVLGYGPVHDASKHPRGGLVEFALDKIGLYQNSPFDDQRDNPQLLMQIAALFVAEIDRQLRANLIYWCDGCGGVFTIEIALAQDGTPTTPNGPVVDAKLLKRGERSLCPTCAATRQITMTGG